jgi:hypothetical protein
VGEKGGDGRLIWEGDDRPGILGTIGRRNFGDGGGQRPWLMGLIFSSRNFQACWPCDVRRMDGNGLVRCFALHRTTICSVYLKLWGLEERMGWSTDRWLRRTVIGRRRSYLKQFRFVFRFSETNLRHNVPRKYPCLPPRAQLSPQTAKPEPRPSHRRLSLSAAADHVYRAPTPADRRRPSRPQPPARRCPDLRRPPAHLPQIDLSIQLAAPTTFRISFGNISLNQDAAREGEARRVWSTR